MKPLRILLHGLNYAPEEIGIGKYSGEMVADLLTRGCEVTVVTTPPYYPQWKIRKGFRGWWYAVEKSHPSQCVADANSTLFQTPGLSHSLPKQRSVTFENNFPRTTEQLPEPAGTTFSESSFRYKIIRCPLWVPRNVNGWKRIVHLASFGLSSIPVVLWQAVRFRPDVIMTVEPAAICMPTTWLASKLCRAKAWLHVQDFEVDAAFELGILKQPLLKKIALAIEAWLMRSFDRVSSISPKMVERLQSKGVEFTHTRLFPNWVDCQEMRPLEDDEMDMRKMDQGEQWDPYSMAAKPLSGNVATAALTYCDDRIRQLRIKFGIPIDKCIALYAGNIGTKQGLELIIEAARRLKAETEIYFVVCGHGAAHATLALSAQSLDNLQLLPVQPFAVFNELMNCANIHLLPQKGDAADLVMPSKLTGMLATGRPVVACASPRTQIAQVVEGRGCVVPPGDEVAFTQAIKALAGNPLQRQALGRAARQYAIQHLGREAILTRFANELRKLVELESTIEVTTPATSAPSHTQSSPPVAVPAPHLSRSEDKSFATEETTVR